MTVNENMEIVGQLADEWEQVDDTTYRFHIRQGVKFSNGTELTPEIVKDSIQRSIDNNSRGGDLKIANIEVDGENVVFYRWCIQCFCFTAYRADDSYCRHHS